jgi:hypothetical protein
MRKANCIEEGIALVKKYGDESNARNIESEIQKAG